MPDQPLGQSPVYRAGTLVYDRPQLRRVFSWLLAAEVVFMLIDMIEPKVLPILLKQHGASDKEIGFIVGSINALLQLIIMPPVGYYSDRLRTRWGRRIPLLFWMTPLTSLFLAITPFSPEIATSLLGLPGVGEFLGRLPVQTTVLTFGVLVVLYRIVQTVVNVAFFGLLRDVVPDSHMGRFLGLFRVFGALGTFIITYWLLGHAEEHSKTIFIGIALLNLFAFGAICFFVREGDYPPVEVPPSVSRGRWQAVKTFVSESYTHPVYLWMYFIRICLYGALLGLSNFLIFFPQRELGLTLTETGAILSWPLLIWCAIAYPIGKLVDTRGAQYVLGWGLVVLTAGYLITFFGATGKASFLVASLVTGVAYWIVMMAQLKLTQEIFHPQRYSQLAGANTLVQSVFVAVISFASGWVLDAMIGWHASFTLPWIGPVSVGPYRIVNLMMAVLYALALFGLVRLRKHWLALGGPHHYQAPL